MSNLIFIKDNDNNVGIGSNIINDIKGNINITENLNVIGNININNNLNTEGIVSIGNNIAHFSSKVTIKQGTNFGRDLNFRTRQQPVGVLTIAKKHTDNENSLSNTSDGGGNNNCMLSLISDFGTLNDATHAGGSIQFSTQSHNGSNAGHGQPYAGIYGGRIGGHNNMKGELIFYTSDVNVDTNFDSTTGIAKNLNPVMTITGDKNVGIGTNNPYCNLDVNGSIGVNLRSGNEGFSTLKTNSIQINHAEGAPNTTFYNSEDLRLSNTLTIFSPHMSNAGTRTDGGGTLDGHPMIDLMTAGSHNVGYGLRTTIKLFWAGSSPSWGSGSSCLLGFHMKNASNSTEYLGNVNAAAVYFKSNGDVVSATGSYTSDDRIKTDEELIINATNTLLKLRPQKYKKHFNSSYTIECGLIAQEIYYEVPELRYIIDIPEDAVLIDDNKHRNFEDIRNDPDYSNWGSRNATVSYNNLIGYLIKGFQEQNTIINAQQNEINTLKTENQQQQTKINTLETENAELKSIIDKLKIANSFEEFKNSL